jgi:hypothetical protein
MRAFLAQIDRGSKVFLRVAALLSFLSLTSASCSSNSVTNSADNPEAVHIKKVAALIKEFEKAHDGNPPTDIDQLKSWAVQNGQAQDNDFLSTRDKEPYVISTSGGVKPKKGSSLIVHEAKGKNSMLFMANSGSGGANEISEAGLGYMTGQSFKSARPGAKGMPQQNR